MIYKLFFGTASNKCEDINGDFGTSDLYFMNRNWVLIFSFFLIYPVFIIVSHEDVLTSLFLTLINILWLLLIGIREKAGPSDNRLKITIVSVFIVLTFIVSLFSIYTYKSAGVEYFYFCLLFALPYFMQYRQDAFSMIITAFIIIICCIVFLHFDFDFLPRSRFLENKDFKIIRIWNILFIIISFLMGIAFVRQKDELINGLMNDRKVKDSTIRDLVKTNNELMKQKILINDLSEENIQEIFTLAENNSPLFFEKFQLLFPHFIPEILNINSDMIHSELYFCALMKLDFDTKRIAQCTNVSTRAVESKKYRIRKKLGIPSEISINSFLIKI